jgi:replication-associated recombination protein RarA
VSARAELPPTRFDRDLYEIASGLQKSIRRGDEDAAVAFAVELDQSEFGAYCWRRLLVIASEDVGLAERGLAADVRALYDSWVEARKRKDDRSTPRVFLIHAVLALVRARKSRVVDHCVIAAYAEDDPREIPDVALDKHTLAGKKRGRGWAHFFEEGTLLNDRNGELSYAPHLEDEWRERAIEAVAR